MQVNIHPEVKKFISSLEEHVHAKVSKNIILLEEFGNTLRWPHSKKITRQLFELRVSGQLEIRIFYCFHQNTAYLLHGFVKKSQKTPLRELRTAQERYKTLTEI
jgi:phage-related protein